MKQPNPIKNPFRAAYIYPNAIDVDIREFKKIHAWLGRVISWLEQRNNGGQ